MSLVLLIIFRAQDSGTELPTESASEQIEVPVAGALPSTPEKATHDQPTQLTQATGSEFQINWRQPPHKTFLHPNGKPLENYLYYKALAESGNGLAAYMLVNMMRSCDGAHRTRRELDLAIQGMRRTFEFTDPSTGRTVRLAEPEAVEEYIAGEISNFENCIEFTVEQRQEHVAWLELAANLGHPPAMLDYGRSLDDPVAARVLYEAAWLQGDGHALGFIAESLQKTYDQGLDPKAKIPAYAARYAFVTLLNEAFGADPERVTGRWTLRNQEVLDVLTRTMLPSELEEAVELSRQLIESNENCCFSM